MYYHRSFCTLYLLYFCSILIHKLADYNLTLHDDIKAIFFLLIKNTLLIACI